MLALTVTTLTVTTLVYRIVVYFVLGVNLVKSRIRRRRKEGVVG